MDFGSATFNTSVHWMMQRYAELGVEFDEIWGYELRRLDLEEYWQSVPREAKTRLHVRGVGRRCCDAAWELGAAPAMLQALASAPGGCGAAQGEVTFGWPRAGLAGTHTPRPLALLGTLAVALPPAPPVPE